MQDKAEIAEPCIVQCIVQSVQCVQYTVSVKQIACLQYVRCIVSWHQIVQYVKYCAVYNQCKADYMCAVCVVYSQHEADRSACNVQSTENVK